MNYLLRNMTVLMVLNGESSWLCFIACNSDGKFFGLFFIEQHS